MKTLWDKKWFLILLLVAAVTLVVSVSAEILQTEFFLAEADFTVIGEENGDWAAYFASPAGDVNGDGYFDVLVGAPMAGNKECPYPDPEQCLGLEKGEGRAYLVLGKPENQWPASPMNLLNADASFLGCEVYSMTARQLYTAGDVNGDGYDDMLISGWKCGEVYQGKAYLILGKPEADWGRDFPLDDAADASFLGEHEWDMASYYVSGAGDVNGDGFADMLVTVTHNDEAGENAGQVYLILGREQADWGRDFSLANADASFLGEAAEDRIGRAATYVGDINNDGLDDFMIGSVSSDDGGVDAGESYLFLGRAAADWGMDLPIASADASFVGENEYDESGRRVAAAGDVNGDGFDDFLIGASKNDHNGPDAGKTYLILGKANPDWGADFSLEYADAIFIGEDRRDQSGRRVSGAGDPNQDGYDDFLIGAPHSSRNGIASGTAYLIYGRPQADWGREFSLSEADIAYLGKPDAGVAGYDVAWVGDFNGDARDDFLIAAYGGRNNTDVPGEAYLILGNDLPTLEVVSPEHGYLANTGQQILFSGTADDLTDGDLTDDLIWTSSLDGQIGTGGSFESLLSEGVHTITASVVDSGGLEVKDQRTVTVALNYAPEVTISLPANKAVFHEGHEVEFSGSAQDQEDGDLSEDLVWSSDIDGEIGVGASFVTAELSDGEHQITAAVQDSGGESGSAVVEIKLLRNVPPEVVGLFNIIHQGEVEKHDRFFAIYTDGNGPADLDVVHFLMEENPTDPDGVYVKYYVALDEIYLFDKDAGTWMGPCAAGGDTVLSNGVVELDCKVVTPLEELEEGQENYGLFVKIRWIKEIAESKTMVIKLRARDLFGHDTGFTDMGSWVVKTAESENDHEDR
jgi:hypothetical protein